MHAQQELGKHETNPDVSDDERHSGNVIRGLRAYVFSLCVCFNSHSTMTDDGDSATHNPNVTDVGKKQARDRLEGMGQDVEQPGD